MLKALSVEQAARVGAFIDERQSQTGLIYKIDAGVVSTEPQSWLRHILRERNGQVTGYGVIAYFDGIHVEATLVGAPEALLPLAREVARELGGETLLVIVAREIRRWSAM